ncbi:hypothetical protein [Nostoc sp.]|uniref:hypothetical protein n=1 Tax=Nostoc sp. TaxID=1180 RepID=UPI002FF818BD
MNIQWRVVELRRSHQLSTSYESHTQSLKAIALSRKLVLSTRNHRDLGKVPGLLIEDWTV